MRRDYGKEGVEGLIAVGAILAAWFLAAAMANDAACAGVSLLPVVPDWIERLTLLCDVV